MPQSSLVNSVLKALDLLRCVAESPDGMRLNEIADACGIKKTTAHNLIRTLRARGFMEKDAVQRFVAGPALSELARLRERHAVFDLVGRRLREWQAAWPAATLTFSELTPGAVTCRLRLSPDRPGELQRPFDRIFTPYVSPTAICLQATAVNAGEFERRFPFAEHGAGRWNGPETFLEAKREVRRRGFFELAAEDGRYSAAFAVPDNYAVGISADARPSDWPDAVALRVDGLKTDLAVLRAAPAETTVAESDA